MERISLFLKEYGILAAVGLVGAGILIYGLGAQLWPEKAVVEIVGGAEQGTENIEYRGEVVVDVGGAVERPGVYKLQTGSRIGDAIVAGGGLSAQADREWVASALNLAKEVKDGEKVFIPRHSENSESQRVRTSENQSGKMNINTASAGELDKLPEIGEVRAQAIVANRPYGSTEELVDKAKIPASVYAKIKELISVY